MVTGGLIIILNNEDNMNNLGRAIRMVVKNGAVKGTKTVLNTKPVQKVSTLMLTAYLKQRAVLKGKKLPLITTVFAFIFDMALLPVEWCVVLPMKKLWDLVKFKWAGAKSLQSLPSK